MTSAENNSGKMSLLSRWKSRKRQSPAASEELLISRKDGPIPLSLDQQRLWLLQQLNPESPFYNYAEVYKLKGTLSEKFFIESLQLVVDRHEILRTSFHMEGSEAEQRVHKKIILPVTKHDVSHLEPSDSQDSANSLALEASRSIFNLDRVPLIRLTLIKLAKDLNWAVLNIHHIIFDKWSMKIIRDELAHIYQSLSKAKPILLPGLQYQYADYASWQRSKHVQEDHLKYWKKKLAEPLPILALPTDHSRKGKPTFNGAVCEQPLTADLSNRLKTLAVDNSTTLFVVLLAAYKTLLQRYTGQDDLLVGTPFTNRDREEFQSLVGFFDETLVLRSHVDDKNTFLDLIKEVKRTVLDAFEHKETSYETLVRRLNPERYINVNPLFQTMMIYHEVVPGTVLGPELTFEHEPFDFGVAKFDLTLFVGNKNDRLTLAMEFADDLFEEETIKKMQRHFKTLLESIVNDPSQTLASMAILSEEEHSEVLLAQKKESVPLPGVLGVHQLFEREATRKPNHDAIAFNGTKLSYKALNERANNIANHLQKFGVRENQVVAICVENSTEMIAGIFGVLKIGAAYLPLDPDTPRARIETVLLDAEVKAILTSQNNVVSSEFGSSCEVITFDSIPAEQNSKPQNVALDRDSTAYVLYTSGTTGQPKGIQVSHANLISSIAARFEFYPDHPDRFLLMSSFTFDSSVAGIFWTLTTGGTLIVPEKRIEQDLVKLGELIKDQQITHTLLLPSLYQIMLENMHKVDLKSLSTIIVAGEMCSPQLCNRHFEIMTEAKLYNEYGPTEGTVWCLVHEIKKADAVGSIPIGKSIPYTSAYVLDSNLNLVPSGVIGELFIGGTGVSKGYLKRPELTTEKFVPNILNPQTRSKLYKTGDLVSRRSDGVFRYHGRKDDQIKIRGFRVELNEIQELLKQHKSVNDAVVLAVHAKKFENADLSKQKGLEQLLEIVDPHEIEKLLKSIELLTEKEVFHSLNEMNKNEKTTLS